MRLPRSEPATSPPYSGSSPTIRALLHRGSAVSPKDARPCTWLPTGPATFQTVPKSCGCSLKQARTLTPETLTSRGPPLHWAVSSDDVDVANALIDGGRRRGGAGRIDRHPARQCHWLFVLACRSPPRATRGQSRQALACGRARHAQLPRRAARWSIQHRTRCIVECFLARDASPASARAAELLLNRGADLNCIPDYAKVTPLDAACRRGTRQDNVIKWLRDRGAQSSEQSK